jgi:creatinine amidohydrolase
MAFRHWQELSSGAIAALDARRAVAVLPLAATEQHGPHLPVGTDSIIAECLLAEASRRAANDLDLILLPVQRIGASLEHSRFAGTLFLSSAELIGTIVAVGEGIARAGLRKLLLISSHGGNSAAMTAAALECRAKHQLLAVTASFSRFGVPPGLADERELEIGVHGGLVETALMLHFRPDLVEMAKAADFPSQQSDLVKRFKHLRAYGSIGFGWLAGDLNPAGVTGNAAAATAEIGAAIAAHRVEAMLALTKELVEADMDAILAES